MFDFCWRSFSGDFINHVPDSFYGGAAIDTGDKIELHIHYMCAH